MSFAISSIHECPACKSMISVASAEINFVVCSKCGAVLFREEANTLIEKPVNTHFPATDAIQPGTTGECNGESFTVLGRFRAFFEEAAFNYWTIEWNDKKIAYLAEGYGLFAVLKPVSAPAYNYSYELNNTKPDGIRELMPQKSFLLEKKQKLLDYEAEGQFYKPLPEKNCTIYEFAAKDGQRFTYFDYDKDRVFVFEAGVMTFEKLKLQNTRKPAESRKSFICSECKTEVYLFTFPYAQSCACSQCRTLYTLNYQGEHKKIATLKKRTEPDIPLASTGTILSVPYTVIGFAEKEEQNIYKSQWREYTLYNHEQGYAFLSEYNGHWIFLREDIINPVLFSNKEKSLMTGTREYLLFNAYKYKVIAALGEFPCNIADNQNTDCCEYISPPDIWIQEKDERDNIQWFKGCHISHRDVANAFAGSRMPYREGTGAVQPGITSTSRMITVSVVGLLVLLLFHFLTNIGKQEKIVFSESYTFADSVSTQHIVTPQFELTKRRANMRFDIYADVSNSWFEMSATLINTTTGKEYSVQKGVEYYHGYSDGESWSEGSTRSVAYLTRIPAGTYFMEIDAIRDMYSSSRPANFDIKAKYDVPTNRNLWFSLLLFIIWPLIAYFRLRYRESGRWSGSPFAAFHNKIYNSSNDDED